MRNLGKHLAYVLSAAIVVIVSISMSAWGCYDPSNAASIEVVLNRPGISHDLAVLGSLENVARVGEDVYVYRSHANSSIVVIVGLQPIIPSKGAPKYIAVRVESTMAKAGDMGAGLPPAAEEELRRALIHELGWLSSIGVIKGLGEEDIAGIGSAARPGLAGWNTRLVYYEGGWKSYSEVVSKIEGAALLKGAGCSWTYNLAMVPPDPPAIPSTTPSGQPDSTIDWEAVALSLALGVVAALMVSIAVKRL